MTKSIKMGKSEIFKMEHKKSLEERIAKLRNILSKDELENKILNLFILSLIEHGKDKNQMRQIALISKILAESLGHDDLYCARLENAAWIYDIGNVMIDQEIYAKDEKLTFEEFNIVKSHTTIGAIILQKQGFPVTKLASIISAEHHEWWDGGGYPEQNKNNDINIASRIVAIADTVGALSRKRPGRKVWEYDKIVKYIESRSGIQFDPNVVEVFLANKDKIRDILSIDLENIPNRL